MTASYRVRRSRILFGILLVVVLFIGFGGFGAFLYQRDAIIRDAAVESRDRLRLIGNLVEAPLLQHRLSSVSEVLTRWVGEQENIVFLRAVMPNGFELVRFERSGVHRIAYRETQEVVSEGGTLLTLEVEEELDRRAEEALDIGFGVMAASASLALLLVLALWITFQRTAIQPLEHEIVRREEAERALEAERNALEDRVRERTEELSKAMQRLLFHIRQTPLAYIEWDKEFRATQWNSAAEKIFGYSSAEAIGRHAYELIVPPEVVPQVAEVWQALLEAREGVRSSNDNITADGRRIHCEWYNTPLRDEEGRVVGVASLAQDVTDRVTAQAALARSEGKFRALFDNSGDAIVIVDPDGQILDANRTVHDRYGYTVDEVRGFPLQDFETPEHSRDIPGRLERLKRDGHIMFETEIRTKAGPAVPAEVTVRLIELDGRPVLLSTLRDITERRTAEKERKAIERQMQHAQKLESLGVLAGGIAHDFNNILTAILGNADLALRRMNPVSPGRRNVEAIEVAAHRAADLARQMLAYSGKGQFVVEAVDLGEIVREMTHLLEVSISKKTLLRYELADGLPFIQADPTQIRQVVMNLVINASEALGEEGGMVTIRTGARQCGRDYLDRVLSEGGLKEGMYVFLEVVDTGCGMNEETKARIFDPFFTTKFTGRGLGLAAVSGIVRGHRGAIEVDTAPARGSTFRVLFPLAEGSAIRPAAAPDHPEEAAQEGRAAIGTVLLVDDEETVREIGKQMLEEIGFAVLLARDGVEAVDIFKDNADEISIVLLDLTMPRMDGVETFRELRRMRPDVKVLLCSGYNERDATRRFLDQGISGFIQKPYRIKDLLAEILSILGRGAKGGKSTHS
jgi:PAS domain S-box-containing protein